MISIYNQHIVYVLILFLTLSLSCNHTKNSRKEMERALNRPFCDMIILDMMLSSKSLEISQKENLVRILFIDFLKSSEMAGISPEIKKLAVDYLKKNTEIGYSRKFLIETSYGIDGISEVNTTFTKGSDIIFSIIGGSRHITAGHNDKKSCEIIMSNLINAFCEENNFH